MGYGFWTGGPGTLYGVENPFHSVVGVKVDVRGRLGTDGNGTAGEDGGEAGRGPDLPPHGDPRPWGVLRRKTWNRPRSSTVNGPQGERGDMVRLKSSLLKNCYSGGRACLWEIPRPGSLRRRDGSVCFRVTTAPCTDAESPGPSVSRGGGRARLHCGPGG